jgi:hypothetical protein
MALDDRIRQELDIASCLHDWLILLTSETLLLSQWAPDLLKLVLAEEQSRGQSFVVPVLLDNALNSSPPSWADLLRNGRSLVDLTNSNDAIKYHNALVELSTILGVP